MRAVHTLVIAEPIAMSVYLPGFYISITRQIFVEHGNVDWNCSLGGRESRCQRPLEANIL